MHPIIAHASVSIAYPVRGGMWDVSKVFIDMHYDSSVQVKPSALES